MSNRGRPVSSRKRNEENDAVLRLFPDNDTILHTGEIHQGLYERGLVSANNRSKTNKILNRLVKEGFLEKVDTGRYRAKVKPDEFKLFSYLNQLRESGKTSDHVYESSVGGNLWKQNDLYFLGMPSDVVDNPISRFMLNVLSIRLSEIYQGLKELAHHHLRIQKNHNSPEYPTRLLRQMLLEIMPYYIGSVAGIDRDGLSNEDLQVLFDKIIPCMPEFIDIEDWGSDTSKDRVSESFNLFSKMMSQSYNSYYESGDYQVEQMYSDNPEFNEGDFAIMLTDPSYLIDEDAEQRRRIFHEIIELNELGYSGTEIANSLILYEEVNVLEVLNNYAHLEIGRPKTKALKDVYVKMVASRNLAKLLDAVEEGFLPDSEVRTLIESYRSDGISTRDLVYYLSFSQCSLNFISPTKRKYQIIYEAFPTIPVSKINEWYKKGIAEATEINEKTIERISNSLKARNE